MTDTHMIQLLERICEALERLAPPPHTPPDLSGSQAYFWEAERERLLPVKAVSRVGLHLLQGIEPVRDILLANTRRFAQGLPANNALLWGARGMGKSSLIKAVHAEINEKDRINLALVEIQREDISTLPALMQLLAGHSRPFLLFCDDLSFDGQDISYKALKSVLDGGIRGRPENVLFYATSNRRHLLPRQMLENEQSSAIHPGEVVDESVSLSDRFGLWLGFHSCDQDTYLSIIDGYAKEFALRIKHEQLHAEALEWSVTRGARSGRVAWQFIQDLAGRLEIRDK